MLGRTATVITVGKAAAEEVSTDPVASSLLVESLAVPVAYEVRSEVDMRIDVAALDKPVKPYGKEFRKAVRNGGWYGASRKR